VKALTSNGFILGLLRPDNSYYAPGHGFVDVRDVARAHIAALKSQPASVVGRKRYVVIAPESSSYKDAIGYIESAHPELKERLANPETAQGGVPGFDVDNPGLEKVLGIEKSSYIPFKKTVLDTVDSLLKLEKYWKDQGYDCSFPNEPVI
jgi:nucleoside-diphosphate-sugar epimerase